MLSVSRANQAAAFVQQRPGRELSEETLICFCKENISRFKTPNRVIFGPLPTTPTGKIQKLLLRKRLETSLLA